MNGLPSSPFFSPQNEGYNFEGRKMKAIILRGEKLIYALYFVKYNSQYMSIALATIFS